jgi:hypothetical protein
MSPDANDADRLDRIERQLARDDPDMVDTFRYWQVPGVRAGDTTVPRWVMGTFVIGFVVCLAGPAPELVVAASSGFCVVWASRARRLQGSRGAPTPRKEAGRLPPRPARSDWRYGPRPFWPGWWG